jgi:tRNA A37 methylthiotransferase MiaB
MQDQISDSEKSERAMELAEACRTTQRQFIERYMGRAMEVLVEGKEGGKSQDTADAPHAASELGALHVETGGAANSALLGGYTSNYIRVEFTGGSHLVGKIARVRLLEPSLDGAIGEVGGAHFGPQEAPSDAEFIPLSHFQAQLLSMKSARSV